MTEDNLMKRKIMKTSKPQPPTGPWRVQRVITPFPREKMDPARPYELSRREGRYAVRLRNDAGAVRTFATEKEATEAAVNLVSWEVAARSMECASA